MRLIAAALLAAVSPALAQSPRTYVLAGEVQTSTRFIGYVLDSWTGTALHRLQSWDMFYRISRDGMVESIALDIPDASQVRIRKLAGGDDGAVAGIASVLSDTYPNGVSMLFWISPDRQRRTLVPLWPYRAEAIAVAPDGTIWTAGWVGDADGHLLASYKVLRHFDASGKTIGAYVPNSIVRWHSPSAGSELRTSRDRIGWHIGWYTYPREYIELSLDGEIIGRYPGIPREKSDGLESVALSQANELLVSTWNNLTHKTRTYALDRDKRAWIPVTLQGERGQAHLLGFDEDRLVISGGWTLRFYKPAPK